METWQIVIVVVASLLAGAAIPLLLQLSILVRDARTALERTRSGTDRTLAAVAATAERLEAATAGLDERRVRAFMESFDSLARTVSQLRESTRVASAVGAAVGPAVGAAVRAWRAGRVVDGDGPEHRDGAAGPDGKGGAR